MKKVTGDKGLKAHWEMPKTIKRDLVWFIVVIVFTLGITLGYGWRVWQIDEHKTERNIVYALQNCEILITDELVMSPTKRCGEKQNTAIIGLKSRTWGY